MDVSYSAWRQASEESHVVSGESFTFLFDRRYTNRLNRMTRVFFEAYVKATSEVAAEEDRFPSLSEIESRMESGAIYAYKDRLMKSTEFFEEVKISGISYLIPKARKFIDEADVYTDLILDLDEGAVTLPKRCKVSLTPKLEEIEETEPELEPEPEEEGADLVSADRSEAESAKREETIPESEVEIEPPERHEEERRSEEVPETISEAVSEEVAPETLETRTEDTSEVRVEPKLETAPEPEERAEAEVAPEVDNSKAKRGENVSAIVEENPKKPPKRKTPEKEGKKSPVNSKVVLGAIAALIVLSFFAIQFWPSTPTPEPAPPTTFESVQYSAYLSNVSGNTYLNLEVVNPLGLENQVEMEIPADIEKSISVMGGVVNIFYSNKTAILLSSRNNASISVCLTENFDQVPVVFNLTVPPEFESGVLVYEEHQTTRKEEIITLMCNCTENAMKFEQVYNEKSVSGLVGAKERGPENVTEGD